LKRLNVVLQLTARVHERVAVAHRRVEQRLRRVNGVEVADFRRIRSVGVVDGKDHQTAVLPAKEVCAHVHKDPRVCRIRRQLAKARQSTAGGHVTYWRRLVVTGKHRIARIEHRHGHPRHVQTRRRRVGARRSAVQTVTRSGRVSGGMRTPGVVGTAELAAVVLRDVRFSAPNNTDNKRTTPQTPSPSQRDDRQTISPTLLNVSALNDHCLTIPTQNRSDRHRSTTAQRTQNADCNRKCHCHQPMWPTSTQHSKRLSASSDQEPLKRRAAHSALQKKRRKKKSNFGTMPFFAVMDFHDDDDTLYNSLFAVLRVPIEREQQNGIGANIHHCLTSNTNIVLSFNACRHRRRRGARDLGDRGARGGDRRRRRAIGVCRRDVCFGDRCRRRRRRHCRPRAR
jgi:hypothetical protein